jgi:hypothetical protein
MAVAGGQPEKRIAALIISAMLTATLGLIVFLIRSGDRSRTPSS